MPKRCWAVIAVHEDNAVPSIYFKLSRKKTAISVAKDILLRFETEAADRVIKEHEKAIEEHNAL